jgi:hypothetical protein
MTIKMIVDECDKYELPDITDTISFNSSTADSWVSQQFYMSLSFLYIYICYNFTFDDYKYCCVEVHDQLVPCELIVLSLK